MLTTRQERHPYALLLRNPLQRPDQVRPLQVLALVRPQVLELLSNVDFAKLVQHVAHQARLANGALHLLKAVGNHLLAAHDARDRARHLAEQVVCCVDRLLARRERVGQRLDCLKAWVHHGHRQHPYAVLHAGREHGDLREQALIRRSRHDAVLSPLGAAVGSHDHDGRAEELNKVPAVARDGEEIHVRADVAKDLNRCVVLEQQVHLDGDTANVLENGRGLHIVGIGAEAVKDVVIINLQHMGNLRERLPHEWLVEVTRVVVEVGVSHVFLMPRRPWRILAILSSLHSQPLPQQWHFPPEPIAVDLVAQPELDVEAAALDVLLQDVLPHEAHASELGPLVLIRARREVVARMRNHAPASLIPAGHHKLISRAAQMACNCVCPPLCSLFAHLQVHIVFVEHPSLVREDVLRYQLARVRTQVHAEMYVNSRGLRRVGHDKDASQPQSSLQVHIDISEVRAEVDTICRHNLVHVHSCARGRTSESCC